MFKNFLISNYKPIITLTTVVAVLGALYSSCETRKQLKLLQKQNEFIEREFHQSYLPIGSAQTTAISPVNISDLPDSLLKFYPDSTYYYKLDFSFSNEGNGLLKYIGLFSHASTIPINDFRNELLKGNIDQNQVEFDKEYEILRGKPIVCGKSEIIYAWSNNVKFNQTSYLYFYTLFIYKDQYNNFVYDTLHIDQLIFADIEKVFTLEEKKISYLLTEDYHTYSENEIEKLIAFIKDKNPTHNILKHLSIDK